MDAATGVAMASTGTQVETKWAPAPYSEPAPYGQVGFEIIAGGRSIAVVNRVAQGRLEYLETKAKANARRGEPGYAEEQEAREIEAGRDEALATAHLMTSSPRLYTALADLVEVATAPGTFGTEEAVDRIARAQKALAAARGEACHA
jgi:hypothetical protein